MTVSAKANDNSLYIYLSGEMDEHSARAARIRCDDLIESNAACCRLILNLAGIRFMDSTGIGFLIGRYKKAKLLCMQIFIENPEPCTDKILSVSGLYALIPKI